MQVFSIGLHNPVTSGVLSSYDIIVSALRARGGMVDALALGASVFGRGGSSPLAHTKIAVGIVLCNKKAHVKQSRKITNYNKFAINQKVESRLFRD